MGVALMAHSWYNEGTPLLLNSCYNSRLNPKRPIEFGCASHACVFKC